MSSYVYMKALESTPARYDLGMRILSRGRIDELYDLVAEEAGTGNRRVLDIGCGTGGVSLACARRGAQVTAIDINAGMIEFGRTKAQSMNFPGSIDWRVIGAAEIEDHFPEESFEAATACLVFSEMSAQEQTYVLDVLCSRLVEGGRVVVADEVLPAKDWRRAWYWLKRAPFALATYVLAQTTTSPVEGIDELVRKAGFIHTAEVRLWGDAFCILTADKELDC